MLDRVSFSGVLLMAFSLGLPLATAETPPSKLAAGGDSLALSVKGDPARVAGTPITVYTKKIRECSCDGCPEDPGCRCCIAAHSLMLSDAGTATLILGKDEAVLPAAAFGVGQTTITTAKSGGFDSLGGEKRLNTLKTIKAGDKITLTYRDKGTGDKTLSLKVVPIEQRPESLPEK